MVKRSRKTKTKSSHPYKSGFENDFSKFLDKNNLLSVYEHDKLAYTLDCIYNPDWTLLSAKDGVTKIYLETKGLFSAADRRKMLAVREQHPDKDIRLVFMRNNKLNKNSKTTYGDWCDKHAFLWHESKGPVFLPQEWVDEFIRTGGKERREELRRKQQRRRTAGTSRKKREKA